jgi:hypothetical protein
MTADDFRELALSLEGTAEGSHMKHPDFRANGRIFSSLDDRGEWGTVKLAGEEQEVFVQRHPHVFTPAAGAWGRQGWTKIRLNGADGAAVRGAMLLAWQHAMEQPPPRSAKQGRGGTGPASSRTRRARR